VANEWECSLPTTEKTETQEEEEGVRRARAAQRETARETAPVPVKTQDEEGARTTRASVH
jgi:hypothetical protein